MSSTDWLRADPVFKLVSKMKGLDHLVVDEERKVAVPKAGNRWRKLAELMGKLDWERAECFDKDGTLLGVVENEGDDDEDEDEDVSSERPVTIGELARILVDVQSRTMAETRLMFEAQMNGNARIIEGMAEANRTIADSYALALKVSSAAQAASLGGEGNEVTEMLKMAVPMMMMSKQQPAPPPRPAPPRVQVIKRTPPRVVSSVPVEQPEAKTDGG